MKFVSALNYFSFASYHGYYCIFFKKGTVTWSKTNVTKQNFIHGRGSMIFFSVQGKGAYEGAKLLFPGGWVSTA